jgi:hypothetical protein
VQHATDESQRSTCNVTRCDVGPGDGQRTPCDTGALGRATEIRPHATENVRHAAKKGHADTIQRPAMPQTTTGKWATDNRRHATCIGENAADDMQYATGKMHAACNSQHLGNMRLHCGMQRAICSEQPTTCNAHRAAGNMRQTSSNMQRTTTSCNAACNVQHTTWNLEKTIDNRQQGNRQHGSRQQGNMRHAADTAQKTAKPCNACNRQRATDSTRHARGHEHMRAATRKHTALPHFLCGEQGAADKQQHARSIVLDNQCGTRRRRPTHDVTHDRCRSMQQAHAEPAPRSRH